MSSSPPKVRIALVGAGLFATNRHAPALHALHARVEVVAVYSRSEASSNKVASIFSSNPKAYFGDAFEEMLKRDDIDAVDIVLPIDTLLPSVEAALKHGKHVISEKPVAPSVQEGLDFIKKYEAEYKPKGLIWAIAENYFYEPAGLLARDLIQNKKAIGQVMSSFAVRMSAMNAANKYFHTSWRQTPAYQGGFVLDGGVHDVALLRMILGEISQVSAHTAQFSEELHPMDTVAASLKFDSGALATYSVCFSASSAQVVESTQQPLVTIVGTKGTIRLWLHRLELITATNSASALGSPSANVEVFPIPNFNMGQEAVTQEVSEFILAIQEKSSSSRRLYSPRHGLQDVAVIESIINSSKNAAFVSVPNVL